MGLVRILIFSPLLFVLGVANAHAQGGGGGAGIETTHIYEQLIQPMIPNQDGNASSDMRSIAVRSNRFADRLRDLEDLNGLLPAYIQGSPESTGGDDSEDDDEAKNNIDRTTGMALMPSSQAIRELTNGQPMVDAVKEMEQQDMLVQQLTTMFMTDPAVGHGITSAYRIAGTNVSNAALVNINMMQQMAEIDDWRRANFLETMNGCLTSTMRGGTGYMEAHLLCMGDSTMRADDKRALKSGSSSAKQVSNPQRHHPDRVIGGSPTTGGTQTQLSLSDRYFAVRTARGEAPQDGTDWARIKTEYVGWFGDYIANFSGGEEMSDSERSGAGTVFTVHSFPGKNIEPTVNYLEEHEKTLRDHFTSFANMINTICEERANPKLEYNGNRVRWAYADDTFEFLENKDVKERIKELSTPDTAPPPVFVEAIYNLLGVDAEAANKSAEEECKDIKTALSLDQLTSSNKYLLPAQIIFWYAERVTELKFFDFFIAMKNKIESNANTVESQDVAPELVKRIKRRARVGVEENSLEIRRAYIKQMLEQLIQATVGQNRYTIGNSGRSFVGTFAAGEKKKKK
ncbi:MAG: hypothetical protein KDD62_00580 [Bdellovibrionales bacterium]|nr:hypothetical protein [Bdellovibrionales bacterium]